jgi:transcription-repair coupling factor (superfamily II helicase)
MNMNMLDYMFSPRFKRLFASGDLYTGLDNIDRDLIELAAAGLFFMQQGHVLWIVGENENLKEKKAKLELWLKLLNPDPEGAGVPIHFYTNPFEDPYINNDGDVRAIGNKARLIADILGNKRLIVITTLSALSLKIEDRSELPHFFLELEKDRTMSRDTLIRELGFMSYRSRNIVEERGDISWRGSIVDVFPIDAPYPVRIEIEGDTVISLRIFDPDSQKSLKRIDRIVFPLCRFFINFETCADYFNGNQEGMQYLSHLLGDYRLIVSDSRKIIEESRKLLTHYEKIYDIAAENESTLKKPSELFTFKFPSCFEGKRILSINETWDNISSAVEWVKLNKNIIDLNLEDLRHIREALEKNNYRLFIFSPDEQIDERLAEHFRTFNHIAGKIPHSFENRETGSLFLADRDFRYIEPADFDRDRGDRLKSERRLLDDIELNDMVVHQVHGIGRFVGFKKLTFEGHVSEFLKIEYLNREYLYVPVYELDVLSKYISFEGYVPQMDRMGGNTWNLKKRKARKSIVTFARELLELYAMRKAIKGNAYSREYELEEKLAGGFEYVETRDQKRAIKDVLIDLEAESPMDRLICGDVSFGKTEVAIRAALRVVANGKQVALLCPTTILAYQHYATFKKRLAQFPVTLAMLSRMVSQKRKKTILKDLSEGKLDIIIGTHALISEGVVFNRLGLYIIDEEQRFGVFQKEKLKTRREDIDVLSMSATPIPRTLSLSLAGLQDISTIRTPPIGRLAVKNYVGYFSREIVISAVLNEMERSGSVFIVYNDIERIYTFKEEFRDWLPHVPAVVIHAKMNTREIETNLMDFIDKKYRVLISTTIIENGIDIPDVNTLIILDADRFGLTQLYQLRGRIGRGNRQAYAYFLVRKTDITEKARARLDAIREFADLGSGYKLAEFDLKLRGAGSLLGNKQHGHIEALGFDYYHQMLVNTIQEMKGERETQKQGKINIHFSYSIDPAYIRGSSERIALYRQILEAEEVDTLEELKLELTDRYGRLPDSIEKIFFAGMIRILVNKWSLEEVDVYLDKLVMKFREDAALPSLSEWKKQEKKFPGPFKLEPLDDNELLFTLHFTDYKTFMEQFAHGARG